MNGSGWGRSLGARLAALILSVTIPAALSLAALVTINALEARRAQERALAAKAEAVSAAVDTYIAREIATAEAIAASEAVARRDWPATRARIDRLEPGPTRWIAISDASGRTVLNTYPGVTSSAETGLPRPANILAAVNERRARVSDLFTGTKSARPVVAIDAPVLQGSDDLVVSLVLSPELILRAVSATTLPAGGMVTVVDGKHRVVARTRDHARYLGRLATDQMREAMARTAEGVVPSRSLDGERTMVAFHRSALSGWTAMVVVPREQLEAAIWANAIGLAALILLIGIGSFWVMHRLARVIAGEARALQADAVAVGHGHEIDRRDGGITEFDSVQASLVLASAELRMRSDRQKLLIKELNHRVKNTLATVQALAVQTLRAGDGDAARKFQGRLVALGEAHDLLTRTTWTEVDIRDLVLRCAGQNGDRISALGPAVLLKPEAALGLCMCLHELETNSLKYGALAAANGRVSLSWATTGDGGFELEWRETGAGPVLPPAASGFGTRLMDRVARNELGGAFEREYGEDGLVVRGRFRQSGASRWSDPS